MSRLLALEWDAREARVVVARRRGREAVIEQAFAESWRQDGAPAEGETPAATATRLGARLAEMLAEHGVRRIDTLVAVGRANIELRLLSLPPVPPEELPDIVRFQALKQFSSVGDNWPLDFVPVDSQPGGAINVLAAAISPDLVQQIRRTCAGAEVDPKRLVLRPYAAASLWQHHGGAAGCLLMIDLLAEEVDLTVLVDGHVGFIRTVRLPHGDDAEEQARWLSGEAKRTIAAAANQLGGRRAERVVMCGDNDDHAQLRKAFEPLLNLPVELFDPFDGLILEKGVAQSRPTHRGRYAPLLGMVVEEAAGIQSGVDFLNPRKAPAPPDRRRLYSLAGAVAAAVALLLVYLVWNAGAEYDDEVLGLRKEMAAVDEELKKLERPVRETQAIDEFVASDVTWLDELYRVSDRFLPPEQAIVSQLSALTQQSGGGQLILEGHVRQSDEIDDLEARLRDVTHRVSGAGGQFDPRQSQYPWQFKESIVVAPPGEDRPAAKSSSPPQAAGSKPSDTKSSPPKSSAPKPSDSKSSDSKSSDSKSSDSKSDDKKSDDKKSDDKKSDDKKSDDKASDDEKSDDRQPADSKPGASREDDAKPGDTKEVDSKTAEPPPDKPSADKPSSDKPSADKPSADKPSADEAEPAEEKPSEAKPASAASSAKGDAS
ncbi:MAG: hypothetical protein U0935_21935 [Pirellulales bacterium]